MSAEIRSLQRDDLDRIFDSKVRAIGLEWLERQSHGEVYVAVAELESVPVGRMSLDLTVYAEQGAAYLWSAHVEPDFQCRGIGTALADHLEEIARDRGLVVINLRVGKANRRARQLYERLGYEVCGEETDSWSYLEDDGAVDLVDDCWAMRKHLT